MEIITIKRKEDLFNPKNMFFGTRIYPAHATIDDQSTFYGLTEDEAKKLLDIIPEGMITGQHKMFASRQFKFPSELSSGMMIWDDGTFELWVEYASKRISVVIPIKY